MPKTYVLDASAFIYGMIPDGEIMTPPTVYAEIRDEASALRLELLTGLAVRQPEGRYVEEIKNEARETGDIVRLSAPDVDLLALAAGEAAEGKDVAILSDDYAVQNVARKIGMAVLPLHQKRITRKIVWEKRCTGCHRTYAAGEVCSVCGSPLRLRKRSATR